MNNDKKHIWDDPKNVKTLLKVFFTTCFLLFIIDFIIHRHAHMPWEAWPGFYAFFGFVACVVLVLVAKYVLRTLVKRDERYYE